MDAIMLFVDGSVNTKSKVGYGASLCVSDLTLPLEVLKQKVILNCFEDTSSTKLELQNLLWALNDIEPSGKRIIVYTDSQNIEGLLRRRERLEKNDYYSKKNIRIKNHELYKEFYRLTDLFDIEIIKVKGHKSSKQKDDIDAIFTIVDRASRRALRNEGCI